jgi:hypothetical protein
MVRRGVGMEIRRRIRISKNRGRNQGILFDVIWELSLR